MTRLRLTLDSIARVESAALLAPPQDGDLETARVREQRSQRPDILKGGGGSGSRKKSQKAESNGEAVTVPFNGELAHSEKSGKDMRRLSDATW